MFGNMLLRHKFLVLEGISLFMLLVIAVFSLVELRGSVADEKINIQRLDADIQAMASIDTMDIAMIKEAKIAKDVWLRGSNEENIKKYRELFIGEKTASKRTSASRPTH